MKYGKYLPFILILLLAAGTSVYGQEIKTETTAPVGASIVQGGAGAGGEKRYVAVAGQDNVQHVEITAGEYYFDPNYIVIRLNTPVELKVKKTSGIVPHDFVINAPEAGMNIKAGLSDDWKTFTFTPTRAGKYEMFCDKKLLWFKSHKDRGMDGFIEVVP